MHTEYLFLESFLVPSPQSHKLPQTKSRAEHTDFTIIISLINHNNNNNNKDKYIPFPYIPPSSTSVYPSIINNSYLHFGGRFQILSSPPFPYSYSANITTGKQVIIFKLIQKLLLPHHILDTHHHLLNHVSASYLPCLVLFISNLFCHKQPHKDIPIAPICLFFLLDNFINRWDLFLLGVVKN